MMGSEGLFILFEELAILRLDRRFLPFKVGLEGLPLLSVFKLERHVQVQAASSATSW